MIHMKKIANIDYSSDRAFDLLTAVSHNVHD